MGFWSSIGSAISSVGSAIGSACSAIGSAVSSFASSIAPVIGSIASALAPVATGLAKFATDFLQKLGILKPEENTEDMGDRALQAADRGITIDKFENFDDYMTKLREEPLDPEKSKKYSDTEKLVAGLGVGTVGVEEKFNMERGSLNGMWLLPMANGQYFNPERMQTLVSTGRLGGDVFAYLEKRLSAGDTRSLEKRLEINADGTSMNNAEMNTLYDALDSARESFSDMTQKAEEAHQNKQGE